MAVNVIFNELGAILIVAALFAFLLRIFRQPMIPAYVLAGLFLGPIFGIVMDQGLISGLSEIGVALLLFLVGMEIDISKLKDVGLVANLGGITRSLIMFSAGFLVAIFMGVFTRLEAIYIGLILAFSSTMVVVKLLSDKRELDYLHGRIALGILLIEDIIAVLVLSFLMTINGSAAGGILASLGISIGAVIAAFLVGKYILPSLFKIASKSNELLFLLSIGVCFAFAIAMNYFGFSLAIGAFIAGVTLGSLPYNVEIISRITPLRDFFAIMFFVSLGLQLTISSFDHILLPLAILLLLTIVFKPYITVFLCSFFGYRKRPAFLTAISLAQTSEFSLIIAAAGLSLGHISQNIFTLAVLLAIITITISSYLIKYNDSLFNRLSSYFSFFDRFADHNKSIDYAPQNLKKDVILCGYNRIGYSIIHTLKKMKKSFLVVDYNPEVIRSLTAQKIPCVYGDIGNPELLDRVELKHAKIVISTVPSVRDNILLIRKANEAGERTAVYVTANQIGDALKLYDAGADYVILPHVIGGDHVSLMLEDLKGDMKKLFQAKARHIHQLKARHMYLKGHLPV